jgi:hypothetical protein
MKRLNFNDVTTCRLHLPATSSVRPINSAVGRSIPLLLFILFYNG